MGFTVGMPMKALKVNRAACIRKGKPTKHAAPLRKIVEEAGTERYSRTKTMDPSRSELNGHYGKYASGVECADAMLAEAEEYSVWKKENLGSILRKDAVIGVNLIVKPHWPEGMSDDEKERFLDESHEVLVEMGIMPEQPEQWERHRDEAELHDHCAWMAYDKDGHLAGSKLVDVVVFNRLNAEYPQRMRERGWDVDGLALTPEERAEMTPEELEDYDKARKAAKKNRKSGLDANEYMVEQDKQKAAETLQAAEELRAEMEAGIARVRELEATAKANAKATAADKKAAAAERKAVEEEYEQLPRLRAKAKQEGREEGKQEGYAEGMAKARQEGAAAAEEERQRIIKQAQAQAETIREEAAEQAQETLDKAKETLDAVEAVEKNPRSPAEQALAALEAQPEFRVTKWQQLVNKVRCKAQETLRRIAEPLRENIRQQELDLRRSQADGINYTVGLHTPRKSKDFEHTL